MTAPTSVAAAVEAVLSKLRSALGTGEVPDGSNHNFITDWYNVNVAKIGNGPWCQMTATWSVWTAGDNFKTMLTGTAWTVQAARNAQQGINGSRWLAGTAGIAPGDQVYYDWSGSKTIVGIDHVGTIEKVLPDGTYYTLEGNAGNALRRMHRDDKYMVGYVRHNWALVVDATPTPTPVPTDDSAEIKVIQGLVKVTEDGVWGPKTDAAFLAWRAAKTYTHGQVQLLQKTLGGGLAQDGVWGPLTDEAVLKFRKLHLVK